jgi:hypothetical protein
VGGNDFELSILHFLVLHLIFNVELFRPYFLPLLETLDVAKQLAPTKVNPSCIKKETVDQIMVINTKDTRQ